MPLNPSLSTTRIKHRRRKQNLTNSPTLSTWTCFYIFLEASFKSSLKQISTINCDMKNTTHFLSLSRVSICWWISRWCGSKCWHIPWWLALTWSISSLTWSMHESLYFSHYVMVSSFGVDMGFLMLICPLNYVEWISANFINSLKDLIIFFKILNWKHTNVA